MPLEQKYLDLVARAVPAASSPEILARLSLLYDCVVDTNARINITSLTSPIDVTLKHIVDSLTLLTLREFGPERNGSAKACDVGCGGGFPGLPIACALPDLSLTMIDSTEKKIRALEENASLLGLKGVKPLWGRGEELAAKGASCREAFDLCVSRAVAALPVLCELCLPFVGPGGLFVAMKGMKTEEEVQSARSAIAKLGGSLLKVKEVAIDLSFAETMDFSIEEMEKIREFSGAARYFVLIRKKDHTPAQYPRKWAQMTKKHL